MSIIDTRDPARIDIQAIVLPCEVEEAYLALLAHFESDLKPSGAVQTMLVHDLVVNQWRRMRVRIMQTTVLVWETDNRRHAERGSSAEPFDYESEDECHALHYAQSYQALAGTSGLLDVLARAETRHTRSIMEVIRVFRELRRSGREPSPPPSVFPDVMASTSAHPPDTNFNPEASPVD
jgi:hypothetical protein